MPGLMAIRARVRRRAAAASGARITGSLHMTIQTAVLIETLTALGAEVRWCSCNIFSTQDHAAAAVAVGPNGTAEDPRGVPVFAWKGETLEEYWWCTEQALRWPRPTDGSTGPNMILDDGGDATLLVHKGVEFENAGAVPDPAERRLRGVRRDPDAARRARWPRTRSAGRGSPRASKASPRRPPPACTASTRWSRAASCCSRRSTSTTRSPSRKFDNLYGCRHSLIDGINRATDVMIGGKVAVVCGYGDVGKGCAESLRGQGARVIDHRDRPDLRAAGGDGGLRGQDARGRDRQRRHLHHRRPATRTSSPPQHMARMKHQAIVGNIGHFDNEIDIAGLDEGPGDRAGEHQAASRQVGVPRRPRDHHARRGPPAEPRQRDRPSELRDEQLVHQPDDRPDRAVHARTTSTRSGSTCCPSTSTRRSRGCTSTRSA